MRGFWKFLCNLHQKHFRRVLFQIWHPDILNNHKENHTVRRLNFELSSIPQRSGYFWPDLKINKEYQMVRLHNFVVSSFQLPATIPEPGFMFPIPACGKVSTTWLNFPVASSFDSTLATPASCCLFFAFSSSSLICSSWIATASMLFWLAVRLRRFCLESRNFSKGPSLPPDYSVGFLYSRVSENFTQITDISIFTRKIELNCLSRLTELNLTCQ